jgi:hypothetical protein
MLDSSASKMFQDERSRASGFVASRIAFRASGDPAATD